MLHLLNQMSAGFALARGARGFFAARPVTPWLQPAGTIEATSFYDISDLKLTPEHLVDLIASMLAQPAWVSAPSMSERAISFGSTPLPMAVGLSTSCPVRRRHPAFRQPKSKVNIDGTAVSYRIRRCDG